MELVAASVVHFVNSSYPLPVDEILYFDKLCILFLLGMGLLEKVKVGTYQKHNSIDVRHIFLQNKPLSHLTDFTALYVLDNLDEFFCKLNCFIANDLCSKNTVITLRCLNGGINNWEGLGQTFLKLLLSLFHENYIVERNRKRV